MIDERERGSWDDDGEGVNHLNREATDKIATATTSNTGVRKYLYDCGIYWASTIVTKNVNLPNAIGPIRAFTFL